MEKDYLNQIMAYLTSRRMSSLSNLAAHFQTSIEDFVPLVLQLQEQNRLRPALSRCAGSCDSCSSCGPSKAEPVLNAQTILISLEKGEP